MALLDRTRSKVFLIKENNSILELTKLEFKENNADIRGNNFLKIRVRSSNDENASNAMYTYEYVKDFFSGDITKLTYALGISTSIPRQSLSNIKDITVLDVFENFDMDIIITRSEANNSFDIYLHKRTAAYEEALQTKEDNLVLYEAIAEQYEISLDQMPVE